MRSFLIYAAARLTIFGAVWWLLSFTGILWMYSGILAAVVAMLISVLFLGKLRQALAINVQGRMRDRADKRRKRKTPSDLDAEAEDRDIAEADSTDD